MKRVFFSLLATVMLFSAFGTIHVGAAGIKVMIDDKSIAFSDSSPYVDENGRTMIPLRAVSDAIGCETSWIQGEGAATVEKTVFSNGQAAKLILKFYPGNEKYCYQFKADATIGQKALSFGLHRMDTRAVIKNGRTYLPIRYVVEYFGYSVQWDGPSNTVQIKSGGTPGRGVSNFTLTGPVRGTIVTEPALSRCGVYRLTETRKWTSDYSIDNLYVYDNPKAVRKKHFGIQREDNNQFVFVFDIYLEPDDLTRAEIIYQTARYTIFELWVHATQYVFSYDILDNRLTENGQGFCEFYPCGDLVIRKSMSLNAEFPDNIVAYALDGKIKQQILSEGYSLHCSICQGKLYYVYAKDNMTWPQTPRKFQVYRYDPATGKSDLVYTFSGYWANNVGAGFVTYTVNDSGKEKTDHFAP